MMGHVAKKMTPLFEIVIVNPKGYGKRFKINRSMKRPILG